MVPVLHLLHSFLSEINLFNLFFSCSVFLAVFSHVAHQTWIFCRKNKDRYMSRKGERTRYNYFFLSYMSFLAVYFPSRTFTGWKQHKGYWKYVAMYSVLLILINSRQHLNVKYPSISLGKKKKKEIQDEQCSIYFNDLSVKFSAQQGTMA